MNKKDFKNACMMASGVALTVASGATMLGTSSSGGSTSEILADLAQVGSLVAPLVGAGGVSLAIIGAAPLIVKYGKKLYDKMRGKSIEHSQTKTQQKTKSRSHLKEDLMKGFNRGAEINLAQQSKPIQKQEVNAKVVQKQAQR